MENLAEKVDECLLNRGRCVCVQLGPRKLSVIRISGVSVIQGLLKFWGEWKDSRDFQKCPLYRGYSLLRGVR